MRVRCSKCGYTFKVAGYAGEPVRCRQCGKRGRVPTAPIEEWYYRLSGMAVGPVTAEELQQRALDGKMSEDSPVRKGVDGPWVRAEKLRWLVIRPSPHVETPSRVRSEDVT